MIETITARDANHHFSRLLREVAGGKEFVVTRAGLPVARIVPALPQDGRRELTPEQRAALARTQQRLRHGWPLGIERVDRNMLHDEARGLPEAQ
jgi:prevent-host-death family protein